MQANQNQNNLIGFLFDVSGSMQSSYETLEKEYIRNDQQNNQTRFQTVFDVLMKFTDIEEIQNNIFFSLAFGTKNQGQIVDVMEIISKYPDIKKLQQIQLDNQANYNQEDFQNDITDVHSWFIANGAPNLSQFYTVDDAKNDFQQIEIIKLKVLTRHFPKCIYEFINKLPEQVKDENNQNLLAANLASYNKKDLIKDVAILAIGSLIPALSVPASLYKLITVAKAGSSYYINSQIKQQVQDFKKRLNSVNFYLTDPDINNLYALELKKFKSIIQKTRNDFKQESQNILESIAYQKTPLRETLKMTLNYIKSRDDKGLKDNKRIIFIVSDGDSTDGDPSTFAEQLKNMGVIIVCCFVTDKMQVDPNQLYSCEQQQWSSGAKKMFNLSSEMDYNQQPLRYLARNCYFKLSHTGKNRLFIQANNPGTLQKFIDSVSKAMYDTDILLDIIGNVDLEPYIQSSEQFEAADQIDGTCYANAIAAAYYMSMKRIYKRDGGYPLYSEEQEIKSQYEFPQKSSREQTKSFQNFDSIRKYLIEKYKVKGAYTENVIKTTCSQYRLRYSQVNITEAKEALNKGQPLVARFSLCKQQWDEFSKFYKNTPEGIAESFGPNPDPKNQKEEGHAVILIGYGQDHLKFLNSWGSNWGHQGTFKVKNENILNYMKFFHIYWYLSDLLPIEKSNFKENSDQIFTNYAKNFKDIYDNVEYTCPLCQMKSPIQSYLGSISEAQCPKCNQNFYPKSLGQTFINYIYGKNI